MAATGQARVDELIRRIDEAVRITEAKGCCEGVKQCLEDIVRSGEDFIGPDMLRPSEGSYARRLLHRDPDGRYSVVVMVWGVGQGTPLHDHAGSWCVECVYRGRIQVDSYDLRGSEDDPVVQFVHEASVFAGPGEAGALIPPFEYHTIRNPEDTPAVTIHVYKGELTWCNIFAPVEGGYAKQRKELCYTTS